MSYVHCPSCGQKALPVASRCPRCGVPLDIPHPQYPGSKSRRLPLGLIAIAVLVTVLVVDAVRSEFSVVPALPPSPVAPAPTSAPPFEPPKTSAVATADSAAATVAKPPVPESPSESLPPVSAPPRPAAPPSPTEIAAAAERRFARTWVNVRDNRNRTAPVVRVLRPGEMVLVDLPQQGWYRVVADQQSPGFVDGRYLDTSPSPASP